MIFIVEAIILCALFTFLVMMMAKDPIKTLYNYPPKIQERVKSLEQYKDKIPTQKNKIAAKLGASILFIIILSLILRYVNGYTTFEEGFGYGFILWTIVNVYDAIEQVKPEGVEWELAYYSLSLRFLEDAIYLELCPKGDTGQWYVYRCNKEDFLKGTPEFSFVYRMDREQDGETLIRIGR